MSEVSFARFGFSIDRLDENTFDVLKFEGTEELSRPFDFTIDLFSRNPNLHLDELIGKPATFSIATDRATRRLHGAVAEIEAGDEVIDGRYHYQVRFVPRIWLKSLSRHNQIYQALSVVDVLKVELTGTSGKGVKDGSALHLEEGRDFEFRLAGAYSARDYIVQWQESDLDFFQRLLETHGLYYYFDHSGGCDKLVICDWKVFLPAISPAEHFRFRGRRDVLAGDEPAVDRIAVRHRAVARRVVVSDYNDQKPQLDIQAETAVAGNGIGVDSRYGEHILSLPEAQRRAELYADAAKARAVVYEGDSTCHMFEPGHCIELSGHFRAAFNRRYRVVGLRHEGRTETPAGSTDMRAEAGRRARYSNHFRCLADTVEFRLQRQTPRPKVDGLISARIDAEGSGGAAEIDDQGRYKVRFFFDLSGAANGQASCYLRLATPFGGPHEGLHYPLRKGAEVIVSFLNGDPDRPVITGVVPNPAAPNVVTSGNRMNYVTKTPGGVTHVFGNRLSDSLPQAGAQQMGHPGMAGPDRVSGGAGAAAVGEANAGAGEGGLTIGAVGSVHHARAGLVGIVDQPLDQQLGAAPPSAATTNGNYSATLVEEPDNSGTIIGYYRLGDTAEEYDKENNGPFFKVETESQYTGGEEGKNFKVFQYVAGGALNVTYGDSYTYVKGNSDEKTYDSRGVLRSRSWSFESGLGNTDFTWKYARSYDVTVGTQFEATVANKTEIFGGPQTEVNIGTQLELNVGLATEFNLAGKFEFGKQFTYEHVEGDTIEFAKDKDMFASNSITIGVADFTRYSGDDAGFNPLIAGGLGVTGGLITSLFTGAIDGGTHDPVAGVMDSTEIGLMTANVTANIFAYSQYLKKKAIYEQAKAANLGAQLRLGSSATGHSSAKLETGQHCEIELHDENNGSVTIEAGNCKLKVANDGVTVTLGGTNILTIKADQFTYTTSGATPNKLDLSGNQCKITNTGGTKIAKGAAINIDTTAGTELKLVGVPVTSNGQGVVTQQ